MTTTMEAPSVEDHQDVPDAPPVEAPWGYKEDGTPYKVDPNRYANRRPGKRRKAPAMGAPSSPPKRATPNARKPATPDYGKPLLGIVQMLSGVAVMAGKMLKNKALIADGCAAIVHGPPVVDAVAEMAVENRQLAAILEQVGKVGPYTMVIGALVPFVLQVAVNHKGGKPPAQMSKAFGVMSADDLIAHVSGELPPDGVPEND